MGRNRNVFGWIFNKIRYRLYKWDVNRPLSEPGAKNLGKQERSLWLKHIQAVYRIVDKLKEKYPNVLFEACALGGERGKYLMNHGLTINLEGDYASLVLYMK